MIEVRNHSNEYFFAKSKAVNALFFSKYNNGTYVVHEVQQDNWERPSGKLFRDGICYVLTLGCGSYYRWVGR